MKKNYLPHVVLVSIAALFVAVALCACFATSDEVQEIAAAQSQAAHQMAETAAAVKEMQAVLSDPQATSEAKAVSVGRVGDTLLKLTEDMQRVSEQASKAAAAAEARGEEAGKLLGLPADVAMPGVGGIATIASYLLTNYMRDRKRKTRGEKV